MHVSRRFFDVGMTIRKLFSRFRCLPQILRPEWPVISATRPLFYMIRIFGLAPFEISDDHFAPGSYGVIYSFFCILGHTYLAYFVLNKFASIKRATAILDLIENSKVIFNCCVVLLNVVTAIWTRKEFLGMMNIVKNFDSRMRDLGHPRKEGAAKVWVWSMCVCTILIWIAVNRTGMAAFGEPWLENMGYLLNYLTASLSTIKFSSVVLLLGQRFRHLNKVAQRSKESSITEQKYIAVDFKVVQELHNSLMNAGESLNAQYSWSLLLWLINLCIHSVSNLYFLIDWLLVTPESIESQWDLTVCIAWWLVTFVAQLLLLHIACHFTSDEANSIGSIMFDWKSLTFSRNCRVESSLHLLNRRLNFSAAGCFHVNLPLLRSITALLATYLVLLLQFQQIETSILPVNDTRTNS